MSRSLPRRVARIALLAAAGAAPLIGAGQAHAAAATSHPGLGLAGLARPDADYAGMPDLEQVTGRPLTASVVEPAKESLAPGLLPSAEASDLAINATFPIADHTLTDGTDRQVTTNSALTVDGLTTPLRELPDRF